MNGNMLDDFVCDLTCEEFYSRSGEEWEGQEIADTIDLDEWADW